MATFPSTSAAANPNNKSYAVFINHRGVDVKETFARSLYLRLLDDGLTAFLDKDEMQAGYNISSQIEHAVKTATVHVAIFSPRYAESDWCLNELVEMLVSKAPIIPVFYRVTPAHVRWTLGDYGRALQTHEKKLRYDSNTIGKWRNALYQVANNSGFELEICNGEELELELLDKVVKRLSEMVKELQPKMPDLYVADYPTGLDFKLKDFEDTVLLQQQQTGKPPILGIVGLGGVGKTTLAKQFFNKKKSSYHSSCFLSDVRENAANRSLNLLQSQLLKSLIGLDKQVTINNVDEGKEMLRKPLRSCNALIILDDMDDMNQVKALLPVQTQDLSSRSLILITSRDHDVLRSLRVEKSSIYTLTSLNTQHSLELFCSYAFSQPYPARGFKSLVYEFLKACKGLPLSLKVFGALLYGRDKSDWEDELGSLQKILPAEIQKTLIISYKSLNKEEQQIFLDIACFFIGQNRDTAIGIWDRAGWRGRRGFQNLQNKCLVEVDSWNAIHMHDHVRDLRIDVAEYWSPRRLWRRTKNVVDNLLSSEITVRGIRMVHGEYNADDEDDVSDVIDSENASLERILRRLQILDTENALLERILRVEFHTSSRVELPNLTWLRWKKCPHSSLPSWVPLKNLRVLQVSQSILKTLWHREGESQVSSHLPLCLEELRADGCVQLKSIQGLAQLRRLRWLNVSGCSELEELPSMEALVCLEVLWADGCVKLKSIRGLTQLPKLRLVNVSGCSELEELQSIETLASLEDFLAQGCVKLKSIRGSPQWANLRVLNVSGCSELEELPSMETLASLEVLRADGCVKLKSIRGFAQLTKLRLLKVNGCSELEELPNMEALVSLKEFDASQCVKLKSIRGLAQATKLLHLHVNGCSELGELPSMETLVSLEVLGIEGCVKLKSIRGLTQLPKLRLLSVSGSSELEELPNMETLLSLEELWAKECLQLKSIPGLAQATRLRHLDVCGCSDLKELPGMETLVSLEEFCANKCVQLKNITGLEHATKLRLLRVSGCSELEELPSMETLISLEVLRAEGCVKLKSIQGLVQCTKLRELDLTGCSELEELPIMGTLASLELLKAGRCVKLKSIRGSAQLPKLQFLKINGCSELEELPSIKETLVSLKDFDASQCVKLKNIRGLVQATKLLVLRVSGCSELEEFPSMETLVSLEVLDAEGCVKLKSIPGLTQLQKLRILSLSGCSEFEELASMETLVSLGQLWANGCVKLKNIRGLDQCTELYLLNVSGCSELEEVEGVEHFMWSQMLDISGCPKLQCPVWD